MMSLNVVNNVKKARFTANRDKRHDTFARPRFCFHLRTAGFPKQITLHTAATTPSSADSSAAASPVLLDELRQTYKQRRTSNISTGGGRPRICVLGAGVNGLATAVRITQEVPGAQVTIYAERFASDLASHNAAGVWEPYKLSETPEVLTYRWSKETFDHLMGLVHSDQAQAAGVQMMYCHNLFLAEEPDPFWSSAVQGYRRMSSQELALFSKNVDWPSIQAAAAAAAAYNNDSEDTPGDGSIDSFKAAERADAFVDGFNFNTVVCEGRLYMRWLSRQLQAAGVQQIQRKLNSLADVASENWDLVINCCGLGAEQLVPDPRCFPIRGQIMRVKAPWVNQCVFANFPDETSYIIPNREWVVLGGTGQVGNYSTAVSMLDAEKIADRAMQVVPSLKQAELMDHWVGLRPGRVRLRLEAEALSRDVLLDAVEAGAASVEQGQSPEDPGVQGAVAGTLAAVGGGLKRIEGMKVIHNYGHGGSGLTLGWGTAGDAVLLAKQILH